MLQSLQEPHVNLRQLLDALNGVALLQGLGDGKDAQVGGVGQFVVQVVKLRVVVAHKAVHALTNHAQSLLDHLLERATNRHNLAHRLHRRANLSAHTRELRQVPARNLTNHIVERRSHIRTRRGAHLANLVERVAQRNLGSHKSQGIARSLRSQCRRTREARVDLDDAIVVGLGVKGKLDVTLAHDAQVAHTLDGNLLQHLHLLVGQRTRRRHHDTLARVDAQRVEVLHRGHGEATVVGVAYALKLNLLPALQTLFHQNLRCKGKGALGQLHKGLLVGTDARTQSTQRISRANHDGEANLAGSLQCVVHILHGMTHRCLQTNLVQLLHKAVAVLGVHDSLHAGAQHLHAILLQRAVKIELRAAVQGRLSAESQ